MNKLRKIAGQLWAAKERLVLAVMIAVLTRQVWLAYSPPEIEESATPSIPTGHLPEDPSELNLPTSPPQPPPPPLPMDASALIRTNMFSYYAGQPTVSTTDEAPPLTLLQILEWPDGGHRARIQSAADRGRWYAEGEDFEDFTLLSIDADAGTAVVWDGKQAREFLLELR